MESKQGYLQRLAQIDAAVARARLQPGIVVERAAGLLAGRVGCRVSEAHAHLLSTASEQGWEPSDLAAEVLAALETGSGKGARLLSTTVDEALRPPHHSVRGHRGSRPGPERTPDDWARLVQQVLNVMPGDHTVLLPVHDDSGEVEDFVLASVSPTVVDYSGRRGEEIVGRRMSEAYPTVVGGPIWQAWRESLADGLAREVGPVPYLSDVETAPTSIMIEVRIHPIGAGLLNSWVRHDEQSRLDERIAHTERLGNLGWGEADLVTGRILWSDGMYRIYERDPALGPLPSAEQDALTLPEDEPIRRQAVETFGRGETVDMTYRIRIGDQIKHVRSVIDADRDAQGRPLKLYGIVQDVTARESSRARLAEVERQLRQHQASLAIEHRLAAQLQQIVLPIPDGPIDLPGLRVAVRYLPAEQASRVGGDWYHAAVADDCSVVLAVGDVAGHGIHAAATMAQLRHALAALTVTTTTDPAALLSYLNRLLYAAGPAANTATAVVARYDPATGRVVWAQAGHPAPLHTRAGATTPLDRPYGPLLGAIRSPTYGTATLTIEPGDILLCYTDGLIEHRDRTLAEGLAPVIATLNRISTEGSPQPLAQLLAQLRRANPDDDTCILAARPLVADPLAGTGPPEPTADGDRDG